MKMRLMIRTFSLFGLMVSLSACGGGGAGAVKPSSTIPVVNASYVQQSGKYYDAFKPLFDKGIEPFNSKEGLTEGLAKKAAAAGAQAFLLTKSYEKYATGFVNGQYAFVEGFGIRWKPADKKTLLGDLKYIVDHNGGKPIVQQIWMTRLIYRHHLVDAVPLLRQALQSSGIHHDVKTVMGSTYVNLAGRAEVPYAIKLYKSSYGDMKSNAVSVIAANATPKEADLLLSIAKSNQDTAFIAAQALRGLKLKRLIPEWKKMLYYHDKQEVQDMAGEALLDLGQRTTVVTFVHQTHNAYLKSALGQELLK